MEISGQLKVDPPVITQGSDSSFELDYLKAVTEGGAVKRFNRVGKFHISKWTKPEDSITWYLLVSQKGSYKVSIRYAARNDWGGSKYAVAIGPQSFTAVVEPTGDWYQYRTFDLGKMEFPRAGRYTASIRPAADSDHNLMYFQSLTLEPLP
jgi:alpha-L-fucosidase